MNNPGCIELYKSEALKGIFFARFLVSAILIMNLSDVIENVRAKLTDNVVFFFGLVLFCFTGPDKRKTTVDCWNKRVEYVRARPK